MPVSCTYFSYMAIIQSDRRSIPVLFPFCSRINSGSPPVYLRSSFGWDWWRKVGVWAGKLKCCLICPPYPLDIGSCRPLGRLPFPWGLVYGCFDLPPHLLRTSSGAERTSTEGAPAEGRRRYRGTGGREAAGWGVFSKLCAKRRWRHAENFRKDSEDFL